MPCGNYDVWAEDHAGSQSPIYRVNWTGNCMSYNIRQDLILSNKMRGPIEP